MLIDPKLLLVFPHRTMVLAVSAAVNDRVHVRVPVKLNFDLSFLLDLSPETNGNK